MTTIFKKVTIEDLVGEVIESIDISSAKRWIKLYTFSHVYHMYKEDHDVDHDAYIAEHKGNLQDLIGIHILHAEHIHPSKYWNFEYFKFHIYYDKIVTIGWNNPSPSYNISIFKQDRTPLIEEEILHYSHLEDHQRRMVHLDYILEVAGGGNRITDYEKDCEFMCVTEDGGWSLGSNFSS